MSVLTRRQLRDALLLLALATLLRLGSQAHAAVLSRDALGYLGTARAFAEGRAGEALGHTYPPAYPAALALLTAPLGGPREATAEPATALLAGLVAPLLFLLTAPAAGGRAARFAGLFAALLPGLVDLGAELIADAGFVTLLAGALLLATRAREAPRLAPGACLGAALLGGVSYLTRPEGIVALVALVAGLLLLPRDPLPGAAGGGRRRALELALLLGAALCLVVPFLVLIKAHGVPDGRLAGEWKLTLKRDLGERLRALSAGELLQRALFTARAFLVTAGPALPFLALGLAPGPGARPRLRRLLPLVLLVLGALVLAALLVRVDRRYAATPTALLLPWAGLGAARLVVWARARGWRRPELVLALALLGPCLLAALRTRHDDKVTLRDAGALLRRAGARRVLAFDSRVAWYGDAQLISLWGALPGDQAQFSDPDALARAVAATRPDAVVLEVEAPAAAAAAQELARRLGAEVVAVRRPGAEPLDVLLLERR